MEYFLEKLRMARSTKDDETSSPSPYADQERRSSRHLGCHLHYPSPTFIYRVLLARSLKVRRTEGEGVAEFSNSEFVQECLHTHNKLRHRHEVPPLRLCPKLCDLAQYWANHLAHTDDFYYRKFRDVGENLFCRWSYVPDFDVTGEQVARHWYSEIKCYDFLLDPSILHVQAGHFSQMVWRSSTTFGVGKARTRSGKIIVVAMYKPAGNVLGEFQNNVLPQPNGDEESLRSG
ncbi:Golgi-associated plant pathogenesis-related protein 1-like [Amblyomma americanum]